MVRVRVTRVQFDCRRMHTRRFTRLTNAFSKKVENHAHSVALFAVYYNFVRIHKTLRTTPGMAANVTKRLWEIGDIVDVLEAWEGHLARLSARLDSNREETRMPIFVWLGLLAMLFGVGDWIALAFWLFVMAAISIVLSVAMSKIWPDQDWAMMQGG